jgi:hypothetical protein
MFVRQGLRMKLSGMGLHYKWNQREIVAYIHIGGKSSEVAGMEHGILGCN